ncbi:MAG: bifunctional phosphopantothenoylcysteine decarboxylase/phosphopantothenate synthase, partial [Rhodobacter sp.]|nr:bifunctional phosphopantothenoylcysteine decarboxylase/phosphopantothenate synthase [Rhodobacter sp.]
PASVPPPDGVTVVPVQTAQEMLAAVTAALPADAAVFAAAVADWRVENASCHKMKKTAAGAPPDLRLAENPDILATVAQGKPRPQLVVGFAAETDDVIAHAAQKRARKGCDWIIANDVRPETGIMGGTDTVVTLITAAGTETWPRMTKDAVARRLADMISRALT